MNTTEPRPMRGLLLFLRVLIALVGLSCVAVAAWCFFDGDYIAAALWLLCAHVATRKEVVWR